jgi:hypothetical protein
MIDYVRERLRQRLKEKRKPVRAELEKQHPDLRGRSVAEISAKLRREGKAAKARDRGSAKVPTRGDDAP